jgi:hypothetical protein
MMTPMAEQVSKLTDLLGQDHDLAVLSEICQDELEEACNGSERELLSGLIARRREDFKGEAMELGRKLFQESGKQFVNRIHGYWNAWEH